MKNKITKQLILVKTLLKATRWNTFVWIEVLLSSFYNQYNKNEKVYFSYNFKPTNNYWLTKDQNRWLLDLLVNEWYVTRKLVKNPFKKWDWNNNMIYCYYMKSKIIKIFTYLTWKIKNKIKNTWIKLSNTLNINEIKRFITRIYPNTEFESKSWGMINRSNLKSDRKRHYFRLKWIIYVLNWGIDMPYIMKKWDNYCYSFIEFNNLIMKNGICL